jgi:hypothetical protein
MHRATHTSNNTTHLYRVVPREMNMSYFFNNEVEFYDEYCAIWRPSIVSVKKLIPIKQEVKTIVMSEESLESKRIEL